SIRPTVSASSSLSNINTAEKAFDREEQTEWIAKDSTSAKLTIIPNQTTTIAWMIFDSRQTSLFECWQHINATFYLRGEAIANHDFFFPNAAKDKMQLETFPPMQIDRIDLQFSLPVTVTPDGKPVDPALVHPGYAEIFFGYK